MEVATVCYEVEPLKSILNFHVTIKTMLRQTCHVLLFAAALVIAGCNQQPKTAEESKDSTSVEKMEIEKVKFGNMPDGREVTRFIMKNKNGVEVHVINLGGIITHLIVPDKNGKLEDVVLGLDNVEGYLRRSPYFGAIVGRYGNRIANGKFKLDGTEYTLAQNNNGQHLHGGVVGFDKVFWDITEIASSKGPALRLTYLSKDGEEGYPGNLDVTVEYVLTDDNELEIDYKATTDKKTIVNLTQHTYFNLSGAEQDILDHVLTINADEYVPVSKVLIPTGKLEPVKGSPFDFTSPTTVGERINENHEQLKIAGGYDHCWVLSGTDSVKTAATVYHPTSGRTIEVLTTEPGMQFYSGNFLDGKITGKNGVKYNHRSGLCLETQHFPDGPNQPSFPSVTLNPGETYKTRTVYRFGTR